MGFAPTNLGELELPPGTEGGARLFEGFFERIDRYHVARDYPAVRGPSYLGVHLRWRTVDPRAGRHGHRLRSAVTRARPPGSAS